ncbi:DUF1707 and DUF4190 domain-containing protein [Phytoactinopolyspora halotolerans]|nr:DUF1707 and DUF4190 domain-containing protein [Phytoactinopolyspora halotolerans]
MRASDADRERAINVIKAAMSEGRITWDEHGARVQRVMNARTYGELESVVHDLPSGVNPAAPQPMPPRPGTLGPAGVGPGQALTPMQPMPGWQPAYVAPARKTNDLAIASVACGGFGFVTGISAIPAIITGHMALAKINQTGEEGRGLAVAGLVMGYTVTAGMLMMMMMVFGLLFGMG